MVRYKVGVSKNRKPICVDKHVIYEETRRAGNYNVGESSRNGEARHIYTGVGSSTVNGDVIGADEVQQNRSASTPSTVGPAPLPMNGRAPQAPMPISPRLQRRPLRRRPQTNSEEQPLNNPVINISSDEENE